jgi:Uma2 family endonuclease
MSTTQQLLTAEEYFQIADKPEYSELVRGVILPITPAGLRHGLICGLLLGVLSGQV